MNDKKIADSIDEEYNFLQDEPNSLNKSQKVTQYSFKENLYPCL